MLFMASQHVAEGEFDANCLRLLRKLQGAEDHALEHSKLLKRMKMDCRTFHELVTTLVQRGDVEVITAPTAGRPSTKYRLRVNEGTGK
jgi:DNA-binding IclR family transcriptional regulator